MRSQTSNRSKRRIIIATLIIMLLIGSEFSEAARRRYNRKDRRRGRNGNKSRYNKRVNNRYNRRNQSALRSRIAQQRAKLRPCMDKSNQVRWCTTEMARYTPSGFGDRCITTPKLYVEHCCRSCCYSIIHNQGGLHRNLVKKFLKKHKYKMC